MKRYNKIIAAMLAVMISAGSTGLYAYANRSTDSDNGSQDNKKNEDEGKEAVVKTTSDSASAKDETVYVMTDASGNKTKTIVSDWLKNVGGQTSIEDISDLTDIENLKFDGGYSADGSDITWSANGGDIYYKGYSDNELPVDIKITYTLDGKTVAPEELAGKSGHVTIRYDYINNSKQAVDINGKDIQMYTPFMMATGVLLDGSKFTNVTAVNGKIVSDGERLAVVGCALPGLKESLGLEDIKDIGIPEYFEIEADVTDFEMKTTITSGTSSIFADLDLGNIDKLDELKDKLDQLIDASEKLCSGTSQLCAGVETLGNSTSTLTNGVNELVSGGARLTNGIETLSDGTEKLSDGAKTLDESTGTLADGINDAKSGSDKLVEGSKKLVNGSNALKEGASSLSEGLSTADNGAKAVNDGAQSLSDGSKQLSAGAQALNDGAAAAAAGSSKLSENAIALDEGADKLSAGTESAKNGAQALVAGIAQAGGGAESIANGIAQAGKGVDALAAGAAQGAQSIGEMTSGINDAAQSLDTTIGYNSEVLKGLQEMQAAYTPDSVEYQKLAVMIATLQKTTAGQQAISQGLKDGAGSSASQLTALTDGISQLQAAFNGDGTQENPGLVAGSAALSAAFSGTDESVGLIGGSQALSQGVGALDDGAKALANGTEQFVTGTASLDDGVQKLAVGAGSLAQGSSQLSNGASTLAQGTASLSQGITAAKEGSAALSNGIVSLDKGVAQLSQGEIALNSGLEKLAYGGKKLHAGTGTLWNSTVTLNSGVYTLKDGSYSLYNGLLSLQDGTVKLTDGINKLVSGAKELDSGMIKFKTEGIDKITNVYNNDLTPLFDRLDKLTELSRDYTNFSGAAKGVETDVKFIYETAAIN